MSKLLVFLVTAALAVVSADAQKAVDNLVLVKGGAFKDAKSTNYYGTGVNISSFYIGKYDVTQKEWTDVMGGNPAKFKGDNLPVEMVTWYECVEYCNKRSVKAGLRPYYNIDKDFKDPNNGNAGDDIKWTVMINVGANGYRLPTEAEWEYAAGGGQQSKSYTYSGSDDIDKVAWYWKNSGDTNLSGVWSWPVVNQNHDQTHPVGTKAPNELGLYDMSGNVRQFCWDWYGALDLQGKPIDPKGSIAGAARVWKGGGWMGGDFCCFPCFRAGYETFERAPDQGFRVCRGR